MPIPATIGGVIATYDQQVRANQTPAWDTIKLVSIDDDGIYGAWGEVVDLAAMRGLDLDSNETVDALQDAFEKYQAKLRAEVEARTAIDSEGTL